MRMKQLLYFTIVAEEKSIEKASQRLYVSRQAVSKAIQNLEYDLNKTLLTRLSNGVELTEDGKEVLDIAKQILALNDILTKKSPTQDFLDIRGTLNIIAIQTFIDYLLPDTQIDFIKKYPAANVFLSAGNYESIKNSLLKKSMDIGFCSIPYINNTPLIAKCADLSYTSFFDFKYYAAIGAESALAKQQSISIKKLLQYPIVILKEQIGDSLESYVPYQILAYFHKPQIILASSRKYYANLIKEEVAVSLNTSVSFNNVLITEAADPNIINIPIRENIFGELCYIIHKHNTDNLLINTFLQTFHKKIGQSVHLHSKI